MIISEVANATSVLREQIGSKRFRVTSHARDLSELFQSLPPKSVRTERGRCELTTPFRVGKFLQLYLPLQHTAANCIVKQVLNPVFAKHSVFVERTVSRHI